MKRKYELNERVFDVINPESAYWIGFLYGDGNCTCSNKVRIALQWSDREHLFGFRNFIGSIDRPVKEIITDRCHNAHIEFRSWRVHNTLQKYELTKRKEERGAIHPDLLQYDIVSDFIRGIFDADGCFYYDGLHKNHLFAEITGRMPLIKAVKSVLVSRGVISEKKKIVKNGSVFRIRFAKADTLKLINFLYGNNPRYKLKRKFGLAKDYLDRLNDSALEKSSEATVEIISITVPSLPITKVKRANSVNASTSKKKSAVLIKKKNEKLRSSL